MAAMNITVRVNSSAQHHYMNNNNNIRNNNSNDLLIKKGVGHFTDPVGSYECVVPERMSLLPLLENDEYRDAAVTMTGSPPPLTASGLRRCSSRVMAEYSEWSDWSENARKHKKRKTGSTDLLDDDKPDPKVALHMTIPSNKPWPFAIGEPFPFPMQCLKKYEPELYRKHMGNTSDGTMEDSVAEPSGVAKKSRTAARKNGMTNPLRRAQPSLGDGQSMFVAASKRKAPTSNRSSLSEGNGFYDGADEKKAQSDDIASCQSDEVSSSSDSFVEPLLRATSSVVNRQKEILRQIQLQKIEEAKERAAAEALVDADDSSNVRLSAGSHSVELVGHYEATAAANNSQAQVYPCVGCQQDLLVSGAMAMVYCPACGTLASIEVLRKSKQAA